MLTTYLKSMVMLRKYTIYKGIKLGLFTTLLNLRFSGQFRLGDMSGDNECIERMAHPGKTLMFDFITKLEPKAKPLEEAKHGMFSYNFADANND